MWTRMAVVSTAAVGLLLLMAALVLVTSGGSAGGTLASGRSVMTYSDAWGGLTSSFTADTAKIATAGRTIVIGPDEILIDGRSVTRINRATKSVDVRVEGNAISFVADGRTVAKCPR
jgi:hypothetical protein